MHYSMAQIFFSFPPMLCTKNQKLWHFTQHAKLLFTWAHKYNPHQMVSTCQYRDTIVWKEKKSKIKREKEWNVSQKLPFISKCFDFSRHHRASTSSEPLRGRRLVVLHNPIACRFVARTVFDTAVVYKSLLRARFLLGGRKTVDVSRDDPIRVVGAVRVRTLACHSIQVIVGLLHARATPLSHKTSTHDRRQEDVADGVAPTLPAVPNGLG